jgi:hypothetical protein
MALRDFLPEVFVALGVVEGLSLAIAAVWLAMAEWKVMEGVDVGCPLSIEAANFWDFARLRRWNFGCGRITW